MSRRAALLAGSALAVGGLWLAGASYGLQHGLQWQDARFAPLAYHPWLWAESVPYAGQSAILRWWLTLSGIAAAIPVLAVSAVACRIWLGRRRATRRMRLYGVTEWATDQQAEAASFQFRSGLSGSGFVLGRHARRNMLLTYEGESHVAVYAPNRAGKGISFVIPNCLRSQDSIIVLDIKRENWEASAGARAALGQAVYLFDPLSPTGETARYNPFSYIDRGSPDAFNQLQQLATTIFPEPVRQDNQKFWNDAARSAWTGAAALVAETPALPFTMEQVLEWFVRPDAAKVLKERIDQAREDGYPYTRACVRSLQDYINSTSGRTDLYDNIRKSVSTRLALWFNARVCAATAESDFDLRQLRQDKMSVYVAVSPGDIDRLQPLLAMFFQQVINTVCTTLPGKDPTIRHHVRMVLDEFPSIGAMPHLAKAFAFVAGYWLHIALVLQDPPQLDAVYGRDVAKTILDNCEVEVVFGSKSQELTESLSKRVGDDTTTVTTEQRPRFWATFKWSKQSESEHPHRRPLLLPQEISRLPDTHQIILRRGVGPIRSRKIRWFEDRVFAPMKRKPPAVPPITVDVPIDDGTDQPRGDGTRTRNMREDLQREAQPDLALEMPGLEHGR